jgi:hypothetical protein
MLVLALIAGLCGWRMTRGPRRSLFYDEQPGGMSDDVYERRERRRHALRKVANAALYALVGAAIGWATGLVIGRA